MLVYFKNALVYQKAAVPTSARDSVRPTAPVPSAKSLRPYVAASRTDSRAMDLLNKTKPMTVEK